MTYIDPYDGGYNTASCSRIIFSILPLGMLIAGFAGLELGNEKLAALCFVTFGLVSALLLVEMVWTTITDWKGGR